ncbi:MAG TPA: hypothetical protein DDY98_00520 [Ruminococcaceae bacterium]|nr:hypothetical protein [Oscillospiraceae bacterium]
MIQSVKLRSTPNRFCTFFKKDDPAVPSALFTAECAVPDLSGIRVPLPSRKKDYTCSAWGGDGALWLGSNGGLTRWFPDAHDEEDKVMYFSANRYLPDNHVQALLSDNENGVWVLTKSGVVHVEMKVVSPREKAYALLDETLKAVDRRGMVSQKKLAVARDISSAVPYGHSDNDGDFTAGFAIGEIFHYAVLKREKGEDDPETKQARKVATRACEACLLLMHISKRGNGFVARSYLAPDEPVPDDGLFYRLNGNKAVCLETSFSKRKNLANKEIDASTPIPERLRKLYTEKGYEDDGLIYKGDTSSDEISLHFLHIYFAHKFLGEGDPELDELLKQSAAGLAEHIVTNGYELMECDGNPTTWAKWSLRYFATEFGWPDAPLNAAEVLMYIKVTQSVTGDYDKWQKEYQKLLDMGYADLPAKHYDRAFQASLLADGDVESELMYGDNMLCVAAFWALIDLEEDKDLREKYLAGFRSWYGTICRECCPGYEYPYALCCGRDTIDLKANAKWFERTNMSRLAAGVSLGARFDIAKKIRWGGYEETSFLLEPDEHFIAKYDRNPWCFCEEDSGGVSYVESCYVYTFAYWIGIYYGFIED